MTDPIHPSNPLPADEKRLSRVGGGLKDAFAELEKKLNDFQTTVIQVDHRNDAETELDDDDHHNASVTAARLSTLIDNY